MAATTPFSIRSLAAGDVALMEAMLTTLGEAFDDVQTYGCARPSAVYLRRLLGSDHFIALAALKGDEVVGGIAAYADLGGASAIGGLSHAAAKIRQVAAASSRFSLI